MYPEYIRFYLIDYLLEGNVKSLRVLLFASSNRPFGTGVKIVGPVYQCAKTITTFLIRDYRLRKIIIINCLKKSNVQTVPTSSGLSYFFFPLPRSFSLFPR